MADSNTVKSRRDQHLERMRKKYPEKQFADDEELFGQISDDYDQYEQENNAYKEREKSLSDMFRADPRSAYFLNDMRQGTDPVLGLVKRFGMEVKDVLDNPDMQEKLKEANQEYLDRVARSQELEQEYDTNMDATLETLSAYQQENELSDEDIDSITAAWLQIVRDGVMGKLTKETIILLANALNYDADVAGAKEEGEVAGRNAKIVEKMRQAKKGDGLQNLNGKNNNGVPGQATGGKSMFDWANEAN